LNRGGIGFRTGGAEQMALTTAALSAALVLPTLSALAIDVRTLNDISVWAKPLKFQFSFALHWLTLALLLRCIDTPARESNMTLWLLRAAALSTLIELLYITLQAARGRASHFNFDTALERLMYYGVMGPASLVIVGVTAWVAYPVWRHPQPGIGRGLVLGASLGLFLSGLVTLLVTAPLAAGIVDGPGHWVGGIRSDADGLPLFGWSNSGGDLRAPHFFATHLLQALPLAGWFADRIAPRRALEWVSAASGLGLLLVASALWQALAARPFPL
jgi:hypothetical protein